MSGHGMGRMRWARRVLVEGLESRMLLDGAIAAGPPFGHVDIATSTTVAGWAFDSADAAGAVYVSMNIDGGTVAWTYANLERPDLAGVLRQTEHGFLFSLPTTLAAGAHRVDVYLCRLATDEVTWLGGGVI